MGVLRARLALHKTNSIRNEPNGRGLLKTDRPLRRARFDRRARVLNARVRFDRRDCVICARVAFRKSKYIRSELTDQGVLKTGMSKSTH